MSLPKLVFIDTNNDLISELSNKLNGKFPEIKIQITKTNILSLTKEKNTAFVSPANSYGDMNGGIDYVLAYKMFKQIQPIVHDAIEKLGIQNATGEYYLPIGSTIIVPVSTNNIHNQYLISAPTMLTPQDISGTDNCYHAMYAILKVAYKYNKYCQENGHPQISQVIVPGLGTGVGGIIPSVAAAQVFNAIDTFVNYDLKKIPVSPDKINYVTDVSKSPNVFINNYLEIIQEQEDNNVNIFHFDVKKK